MAVALHEDRETHGGEATAERPDGTRVSFIAYPTPLHDHGGSLLGAVNVLVDVTARRQAERALRETTRALTGSNAVKDEFLGLVSHELRTPVTTIFGNAQMLRDRADRLAVDDRRSMVEDIAEDSGRLLGIIENLLLFTRLGAGAQPEFEPQVLDRVVRNSIAAFGRRHVGRRITFDGVPRQLIVEADRTYLELLMENLLTNAHKYSSPAEAIEVAIDARPAEAIVTVRDRGIGLGDDASADLFAPFFRTESARRHANGIGVGLAVCKRVVESHGGRIWAAARDGGGSEFAFGLPLVEEHGESA
jgi:signal transduction histidine kinase